MNTFPAFFNLPLFSSFEKSLVGFSKNFKDKRQRSNFLVLMRSILYQGSPLFSLAQRLTLVKKKWIRALSRFINFSRWNKNFIDSMRYSLLRRKLKSLIQFVALDFTALVKTGSYFELQCNVYDGRDGKIKNGYPYLLSAGINSKEKWRFPLTDQLISWKKNPKSENQIIIEFIKKLHFTLEKNLNFKVKEIEKLIFLADREFDRKPIIVCFLEYLLKFIIQAKDKKVRLKNGKELLISQLKEGWYPDTYIIAWKLFLNLMVYREKNGEKTTLLTNLTDSDLKEKGLAFNDLPWLFDYRWQIDDLIEELKQKYGLEKFRVRKWQAIEKILSLILLAQTLNQNILRTHQQLAERLKQIIIPQFEYLKIWSIGFLREIALKISFFGFSSDFRLKLSEIRIHPP